MFQNRIDTINYFSLYYNFQFFIENVTLVCLDYYLDYYFLNLYYFKYFLFRF